MGVYRNTEDIAVDRSDMTVVLRCNHCHYRTITATDVEEEIIRLRRHIMELHCDGHDERWHRQYRALYSIGLRKELK